MKKLLVIALLMLAATARGVILEWDANPPDEAVVGYRVYVGTSERAYVNFFPAAGTALYIDNAALSFGTNYFAVTALNADGLESPYSEEVSWVRVRPLPTAPLRLRIREGTNGTVSLSVQQAGTLTAAKSADDWSTVLTAILPATESQSFFRAKTN